MPCKKNKTCKRICIYCENFQDNACCPPQCKASMEEKINCVSGNKYTKYKDCEEVNADGDCKKFKMDKTKQAKRILLKAIKNYESKTYVSGRGGPYYFEGPEPTIRISEIERMLMRNLINELEGIGAQDFRECSYYDGCCTDHYILYKKDFERYMPETYKKWKKKQEEKE